MQRRVVPAAGQQLVVAAALQHLALFHHHDLVGVFDGRQAVRDDQGGSVLHQVVQAALDVPLRLGVQR